MELAGIPTELLTPVGLVLFLGVTLIRGWFVPGRTLERLLEAERKRGDEWKATAEAKEAALRESTRQVGELLEVATSTKAIVTAIQQARKEAPPG